MQVWLIDVSCAAAATTPHCIWYGKCTDKLNCNYTGPPKPLTDKPTLALFKDLCPDMVSQNGEITVYIQCTVYIFRQWFQL